MSESTKNNSVAVVAVVVFLLAFAVAFFFAESNKPLEVDVPFEEPVEASREITHAEFLQLVELYDNEVQKVRLTGREFKLENVSKDSTIIDKFNDLIVK